jgi:hypothetical protein
MLKMLLCKEISFILHFLYFIIKVSSELNSPSLRSTDFMCQSSHEIKLKCPPSQKIVYSKSEILTDGYTSCERVSTGSTCNSNYNAIMSQQCDGRYDCIVKTLQGENIITIAFLVSFF